MFEDLFECLDIKRTALVLGVSIPQWFCAFPRRGNCSLKAIIEYFIIHTFIVFSNCVVVVVLFCSPSYTYTFTRGPSIFIHTLVFIFIYNFLVANMKVWSLTMFFRFPFKSSFVKQINSTMWCLIVTTKFTKNASRRSFQWFLSYSMVVNKWWVVYAEIQYNWQWLRCGLLDLTLSTIIASLLSSIILVMIP